MIDYEVNGTVATIRFSAGRLNIMTPAFHERLCRTMLRFLRDDSLKAAVLTSAPGQSFSAGDDINGFDETLGDEPDWSQVLMLLPRDKPVIAGVRGYCLGQGLAYLLRLTDIRYATPDARFGYPEIKLGLGGAGVLTGLDEVIPPVIARHLALTGEMMDAETAATCHLVNAVVDDSNLEATAIATAEKIAQHPLSGIRAEMSPLGRMLGGRNPSAYAAQFENLWQTFQISGGAKPRP